MQSRAGRERGLPGPGRLRGLGWDRVGVSPSFLRVHGDTRQPRSARRWLGCTGAGGVDAPCGLGVQEHPLGVGMGSTPYSGFSSLAGLRCAIGRSHRGGGQRPG